MRWPIALFLILSATGCARLAIRHQPQPPAIEEHFDRDDCDPNGDNEFNHVDKGCNNRATSVS